MKQFYKTLSTILMLIIVNAFYTSASAVEIDGIYYYLNENTATVTNKYQSYDETSSKEYTNAYSGIITIPNTVTYNGTTYNVTSIQYHAFDDCEGLISVNLPSTIISVNSAAFSNCPSFKTIVVNSDNPYYSTVGGVLFNKDKTTLICCPEGKTGEYKIPSTVKKIGDAAFENCKKITSISIPDGVKNICVAAFRHCTSLTSINIPASVTYIDGDAFYGDCSLSSTITIPSGIREITSYCFYGCKAITTINIPEGVEEISEAAFKNCSQLSNITLPSTIKKLGRFSFDGCSQLSSINIPDGITEIPYYAFHGCKLTSITLPENLQKIGYYAFHGNKIQTINIPKSVTFIDSHGLEQRAGTKCDIYIYNSPSQIELSYYTPFYKSNYLKIHVYEPLLDVFKTTPNWKEYAQYYVGDIHIDPVTNITLNKKDIVMNPYTEGKLTATVKPDNASLKDVTYTSSNEDVVMILDNTGRFMTLDEGTATITATATDGSGIYATCKIIVGENNITLSDASNSYSNAEETEATTIKYTRTFNSTAWQALYVPFSMKYSDWSKDFEVAAINNVHQYDDDDNGIFDRTVLEIVKVKSGSLKANTPYLIKPKTTGTKTITINNATLKKTEVNSIYCASVNTMYTFTGTYSTISGATMISNGYYGMGGGELVQAEDNDASLGAFRWYLKIENKEDGSYAPGKITVLCLDDEVATGIDENVVDVENKVVGIYDANGRKLNDMRNGLNIVKYSDGSTKKIMK